jgi:hypothetical protein
LQQAWQPLRLLDDDEVPEAGFVSAISISSFLASSLISRALRFLLQELRAGIVRLQRGPFV